MAHRNEAVDRASCLFGISASLGRKQGEGFDATGPLPLPSPIPHEGNEITKSVRVVRTNPISPASENDSCHNRRYVDDLDECEQRVMSKDAVAQKQRPGNKPDYPCGNADTPGASLNIQMVYLWDIGDDYECRPGPTQHFHLQSHCDSLFKPDLARGPVKKIQVPRIALDQRLTP